MSNGTKQTRMRAGFEAQRKAGINVDWFTWQIAYHDAMFTELDIAGDAARGIAGDAARDVLTERARHVEVEGWTAEHDDGHYAGDLVSAAAAYVGDAIVKLTGVGCANLKPLSWPWHRKWWKPSTARRNLVKAAALILAEIERIDRAESSK